MANKTHFVCAECGYDSVKWYGKCPGCASWNTLSEFSVEPKKTTAKAVNKIYSSNVEYKKINDIDVNENICTSSGFSELDRVLGGGIYEASFVLVGGEPGIGKSTLLLQVLANIAKNNKKVLYISGEESARQIKLRAQRVLALSENLFILAQTEINAITQKISELNPEFVVCDSIQTLYESGSTSSAGSVSQIRECAQRLNFYAKEHGTAVIIIGHVTKEGSIAGPRILEHMVDTVLYFEGDNRYRILRAVKNRFGSTNEIGVFEMTAAGMNEVDDFSKLFILEREADSAGSCIFCAIEGTRLVLAEIQALVSKTFFNIPRRQATGLDYNRTMLITAVLEKRTGIKLFDQDIYINVAGGLKLNETSCDLAVALSIISSYRNIALKNCAALGELGLTGEVRSVAQLERRINECAKLGIEKIIAPKFQLQGLNIPKEIEIIGVKNIWQALDVFSN